MDPPHPHPQPRGSPTQSMRKLSLEIKPPLLAAALVASPIAESPEGMTARDLPGLGSPSESNTVLHAPTPAAAAAAVLNGERERTRTLSLYKSLPPLPAVDRSSTGAGAGAAVHTPDPLQALDFSPSPPRAPFMQPPRRSSYSGNANPSWGPNSPQQRGYAYPEHATSRRSLAVFATHSNTPPVVPDNASEKTRSATAKSPRAKFSFGAFLRRKSFARDLETEQVQVQKHKEHPEPEPEMVMADYSNLEPNGYPSFDPPRLPFTPAAAAAAGNYTSDMSRSQSSLSSHRPPSSIIGFGSGSINNRASVLSAKIPQLDDFVAYRYPSMEQPVELFRR
ncbi:hypothetical protein DACRYDRAFT_20939 [Dacryopinax primogenitus]|uniref:Uncharacterized protein n=1 Tax=Dacryopinax primogenitus (strain DJM 731) TaxID=1858805 RepID=M5GFS8_DACPD|nr:uncharacterized protein DACRYDRAFT_20939 [Dacryopinax primogenitus]EJU04393.1 hypothetical protein DACRYDRAFT_20939 [Dacryopinax primogenitus]